MGDPSEKENNLITTTTTIYRTIAWFILLLNFFFFFPSFFFFYFHTRQGNKGLMSSRKDDGRPFDHCRRESRVRRHPPHPPWMVRCFSLFFFPETKKQNKEKLDGKIFFFYTVSSRPTLFVHSILSKRTAKNKTNKNEILSHWYAVDVSHIFFSSPRFLNRFYVRPSWRPNKFIEEMRQWLCEKKKKINLPKIRYHAAAIIDSFFFFSSSLKEWNAF